MTHGWKRFGSIAVPALMVAGLLAAGPAPVAGAASQARSKPIVAHASASGFGHSSSVLSSRLSKLTTPQLQAQSAAQRSAAVGLTESGPGSLMVRDGGYVVDIRVADPSDATQQALAAAGATITNIDAGTRVITATVAPESLVAVASVAGVEAVHEELEPAVGSAARSTAAASGAKTNVVCSPVISEGVAQLKADVARTDFSVDGTGVKVGVLSDSYDNLGGAATGVANGELPGAANPCGHTTPVQVIQDLSSGGEDEGRGMMRDRPRHGAGFAAGVRHRQPERGPVRQQHPQPGHERRQGHRRRRHLLRRADVPGRHRGQGRQRRHRPGRELLLLGRQRERHRQTVGHDVGSYEAAGGYRPTTCPTTINFDPWLDGGLSDCHDFDPSGGVSNGDTFTVANGSQFILTLGWNEPQWNVPTDYDFYLVDVAANAVVSAGQDAQDDTRTASEVLGINNNSGVAKQYKVFVGRFKNPSHPGGNTPRFKMVMFARNSDSSQTPVTAAQFNTSSGSDVIGPTIFGHNAAINAGTAAAVPYNNSATVEKFSSRGPATYCYAPVTGTLVASGPLPSCQTKPLDIAATDGGQTSFFFGSGPPFRFFGTSAAAPHAAGVAALQFQAKPCANQADVLAAQKATGRAVGSFGVGAMGSGLIDADAAIGAMTTCSATKFHSVNPTRVLESRNIPGNIGGYTTRWGPGVTRSVPVINNAGGSGIPATGVSAVVLNVTVTDTDAPSYLSLFPNGNTRPQTGSNLNWGPGKTIANLVTVKVGTGGKVAIYNEAGNTNVIADVVGWYDDGTISGQGYTSTPPTRILESRPISGNIGGYTTPWPANTTRVARRGRLDHRHRALRLDGRGAQPHRHRHHRRQLRHRVPRGRHHGADRVEPQLVAGQHHPQPRDGAARHR